MKRLVQLALVIAFLCVLMGSPQNLSSSYDSPTIGNESKISEDSVEIGRALHGTTIDNGDGSYTWRTSVGETNILSGSEYVPYIWNDLDKSVQYAGMTMEFYDWYTVIKNGTHTLVDDARWQLYYLNKQSQWRFLDLYQHSWLEPVLNEDNMTFGQSYTDGQNIMNITYYFRNCDEVKISAEILLTEDMTVQLRWQTTGILSQPTYLKDDNNFTTGAAFQDLNIMWNDAVENNGVNATFDYQAQARKIDVLFSDISIIANQVYLLDPSVSPAVAADADDAYHKSSTGWVTDRNSNAFGYYSSVFYRSVTRFVVGVPFGSIINDANYTFYVDGGSATTSVTSYCYRFNTIPAPAPETSPTAWQYNTSYYDTVSVSTYNQWYSFTGSGMDDLFQMAVNDANHVEDGYLGLHIIHLTSGNYKYQEDYQNANSNHAYIVIDYTPPNGVPVNDQTPTCADLDDTDNLYGMYKDYSVIAYVSDADGYADIDTITLACYSNDRATNYWNVTYDEDTDTFSETDSSGYIVLDTGASSATESGNDIDATFEIEIDLDHPDVSDIDIYIIVLDDEPESDGDWYEVNWDIETRVDVVTFTLDDGSYTADRGTYDSEDTITASGTLEYYGSSISPTDYYDVWVTCSDVAGSDWSDLSLSSGAFSMTVDSDDVVGLDTYWVFVVDNGAGSGGTKVNQTSLSDTYIADRINVAGWASGVYPAYSTNAGVEHWYDVGDTINVWAGLVHEYDSSYVTAGTFLIDGESTTGDGASGYYADFTYAVITEKKFGLGGSLVTGTATQHGITKFNHDSIYGAEYDDQDIKWTQVNISLALNYGWTVINYNTTITPTATWGHDGSGASGTITYDTGDGSRFPTESVTGMESYTVSSISGYSYSISLFDANTVQVTYDTASISSTAYFWVQYTPDSVWLCWLSGTFTWLENATLWTGAYTIQSHFNTTEDDWAICDATGQIGDLIIGEFDSTWYFSLIEINAEVTVGSRSFDWVVWSNTLTVDILHSIHIEDSGMDVQDSWITFYFHTNWNNATFTIWDNITGTPVEVGYSSVEGWYQIAKPTVVGTHHYYILVNGTHSGSTSTSQTCNTALTSDSWKWREYKFVVNPITFSITEIYVMQNNDSIIVGGIFQTSDLTIDYTIYEDNVYMVTGVLNIPVSGSYYVVKWTKSSISSTANWTLVMKSGTTNLTVYGYNYKVDSASYIWNSAGFWEGDTFVTGESEEVAIARAQEEMWDTMGLILIVAILPFAVGISYKVGIQSKGPKGKRKREYDGLRG